ncbi:MAG: RsfA family transcriptional regulator [Bacillales bacterium]|nr:RsfA family transcriptional regulator [Bacillales bacterium]
MVYRQDGWTKSDDETLAKEVLKKIREGKTQLSAFQEVGERLNRTPSACGFRWNSTLRKIYADEIQAAKVERKMKKTHTKKALGMQIERLDFIPDPSFIESLKLKREKIENTDLEKLYGALCVLQKNYEDMLPILRQFEQVYAENERLRQKIFEMEKDFRMFILEFGMKNFLDK